MQPDLAYANADFIPNGEGFVPLWARLAQDFRDQAKNLRLGLAYGSDPRQRLDLFLPEGPPLGLIVFVHGGYWRAFGRADWSHLAAGGVVHGWAVAIVSYRLAPQVMISEITGDVAAAIDHAAGLVDGPVRLVGHSAGGHLVARMNCADVALACANRVDQVVSISPIGDLRPLIQTEMNADFRLTPDTAHAESPTLAEARRGVDTLVVVGAQERPAFLDQARWLAKAWPEARLHIVPGRHHFDVIAPLADADSALTRAVTG